MKIKFQSDLKFQRDAIDAAVGLFEGQPLAQGEFELDTMFGGHLSTLGFGNRLALGEEALLTNLMRVQERFEVDQPGVGDPQRLLVAEAQIPDETRSGIPHFSVEMETGTGKTYVYLRTLYELHRAYGFNKFIIVVPSVAIREGVLKNIELTQEHFEALYGKVPLDAWVYSSKEVSKLRQFASSNQIQVLVINIDAFNKQDNNVIHVEQDRLSGRKPIEFIQATNPIVIVDEPQNMESEKARAAIASLHPLCTLRYSATHRNVYNLIYRLGPVAAYDQHLVKQIEVDSVLDQEDFNKPYIEVASIDARKTGPVAKLKIDVQAKGGPKRKPVTVNRNGTDLFDLSKERANYRGYIISEINAAHGYVAFGNGQRVYQGQSQGARRDDVMRVQIRQTIKEHFDKELAITRRAAEQQMKVLSLFFIDRVANYAAEDGKIREWFVEEYAKLAAEPAYKALKPLPVEDVHNGYFAQDKKGKAKDTRGNTKADDDAYALIMRDKERLLSPEEPLRFIFSHSALREGWDNPNVFQICTLNQTVSEVKKRQEIGRGLRLPVMLNGERCHDLQVNKLTVVANESYEDFARKLQTEIEEDCGESFEGRIKKKRDRRTVKRKPLNADFHAIWNKIKRRTRYAVKFETADLIDGASELLQDMPAIEQPKIVTKRASIGVDEYGLTHKVLMVREAELQYQANPMPDVLAYLQRETHLTRTTIAAILVKSARLGEVQKNPQQFLDQSVSAIRKTLDKLMIAGIKYELLTGDDSEYFVGDFALEFESYEQRLIDVDKSIYEAVEFDSDVERIFAEALNARADIRLFIKLPGWFKVPTPVGNYNPDWALVMQKDETVYLVRETKSSHDLDTLLPSQAAKVKCGTVHFTHLGVDFAVVKNADEVR